MRSYNQFCGVAKALDRVGDRWTLLLVRELIPGGRRYTDLLRACPGITTNLLAKRLRELGANGLITRRTLPAPAGSTVYELTALGQQLEPVVLALGRFGAHFLDSPAEDEQTHPRWLGLSLTRRYSDPDSTPFSVQLAFDGAPLHLRWNGHQLRVRDGVYESDATLGGPDLIAVLAGWSPVESASITGDFAIAARFVGGLEPLQRQT